MTHHVPARFIYEQLGLQNAPLTIDVRNTSEIDRVPKMIPGAMHFAPLDAHKWSRQLPAPRAVALCAQGNEELETIATAIASSGQSVCVIEGGFEGWTQERLPTVRMRPEFGVPGRSQWVTRERPKIDRLACPWLVRRFIDPTATFFYVPAQGVRSSATLLGAQPYDIADVAFSHRGPNCSFDAFLEEFDLHDPVLDQVADIVRAADTGTLERSREAPGLLAISLGLSATISNDLLLLEQVMPLYDALYAWCKTAKNETHAWPQQTAVRY